MIRTQVLLTPDLKYLIDQSAQKLGLSFSATVRKHLTQALNQSKSTTKDPIKMLIKYGQSTKPVKNAPIDLSSNDIYLVQ